jgi:hypothetical protein
MQLNFQIPARISEQKLQEKLPGQQIICRPDNYLRNYEKWLL